MKNLLKLCQRLRSSKDANSQSLAASLSTRQLIRIAHRLAATPQTHDREKLISDAVHKACLSRFLDLKNVDVSHVLSCAPLPTNHILKSNQIQIFYYTRYVTPRLVTSLRGPSPRRCACGLRSFFRRNVAAVASHWQHCV